MADKIRFLKLMIHVHSSANCFCLFLSDDIVIVTKSTILCVPGPSSLLYTSSFIILLLLKMWKPDKPSDLSSVF